MDTPMQKTIWYGLGDKLDIPTPPDGWFVYSIEHQHTPIIYARDVHKPIQWIVRLQWRDGGGRLQTGRGETFAEAWQTAVADAEAYGLDY